MRITMGIFMISHMASKRLWVSVLIILVLSAGCTKKVENMNIFEFIDKTRSEYKLGYENFMKASPGEFYLYDKSERDFWYKTKPFTLDDGVVIENADLRVWKGSDVPVLINLDISGACITVNDLKRLYPDMKLSSIPRTDSPAEMLYFRTSTDKNNVILFFGFANALPDCLGGIVIREKDDDE